MEAEHLAEHEDAASGPVADGHDLVQAAFHLRLALGYARRFDEVAGDRGEARQLKLVDFGPTLSQTQIHLRGELLRDDVDDELGGGLDVFERVLIRTRAGTNGCREADDGWIGATRGEVAEGGQISDTGRINGGDESDGSRHNHADHELVNIVGRDLGRIKRAHSSNLYRSAA